ncbi:hypothetical protein T484DRAFT_1783867, partial [Baffinella frigidus]
VRRRRADLEARAKETDELRAVVSSLRDQRAKGNTAHAEELEVKERQMQGLKAESARLSTLLSSIREEAQGLKAESAWLSTLFSSIREEAQAEERERAAQQIAHAKQLIQADKEWEARQHADSLAELAAGHQARVARMAEEHEAQIARLKAGQIRDEAHIAAGDVGSKQAR